MPDLERRRRAARAGGVPLVLALAVALPASTATLSGCEQFLGATSLAGSAAVPDDDQGATASPFVGQPPMLFAFVVALVTCALCAPASRMGREPRRSRAPPPR